MLMEGSDTGVTAAPSLPERVLKEVAVIRTKGRKFQCRSRQGDTFGFWADAMQMSMWWESGPFFVKAKTLFSDVNVKKEQLYGSIVIFIKNLHVFVRPGLFYQSFRPSPEAQTFKWLFLAALIQADALRGFFALQTACLIIWRDGLWGRSSSFTKQASHLCLDTRLVKELTNEHEHNKATKGHLSETGGRD